MTPNIDRRTFLQTLSAAGVVRCADTASAHGEEDSDCMHPNTHYIKLRSDRPNFRIQIEDVDGNPVDLRDASLVQFLMYESDGTTHVDEEATVIVASLGLVEHDFDETETEPAGSYHAEFRIDWDDGDEQWFPIGYTGYPIEIVPPPHSRSEAYGDTTYGQTQYGTNL